MRRILVVVSSLLLIACSGVVGEENPEAEPRQPFGKSKCTGGEAFSWSYCNKSCPCEAAEGDCDRDSDCAEGLVCRHNVGQYFGAAKGVDVCLPADWDPTKCTDSDGGKDTTKKGVVTAPTDSGFALRVETDDCIPAGAYEGWVREYHCSPYGGINLWSFQCPAGQHCEDGACVLSEDPCGPLGCDECTADDPNTPGDEDSCSTGARCFKTAVDSGASVAAQCALEVPCPEAPEPCPFGLKCDGKGTCAPVGCKDDTACSADSRCRKGLCVPDIPYKGCVHTDGGFDLFVKGYSACRHYSGDYILEVDTCHNGSSLGDIYEWHGSLSSSLRKCPGDAGCENGRCNCFDPDAGDDDIFEATSIGLQHSDACVKSGWFEDGPGEVKEVHCDGKEISSSIKQCLNGGAYGTCYEGACLRRHALSNPTRDDIELLILEHGPQLDDYCFGTEDSGCIDIAEEKKGDVVVSRTESRNSSAYCGAVVSIERTLLRAVFPSGGVDGALIRAYLESKGWPLGKTTNLFFNSAMNTSLWFSVSADKKYLYMVMFSHDNDLASPAAFGDHVFRYPSNISYP